MQKSIISKNCLYIILLLSCYTVFSMKIDISMCKAQKSISIFNPIDIVQSGKLWNEEVPKNILIIPDGSGVLFGNNGRVSRILLNNEKDVKPEVIIEHRFVKHTPLIKVAKKKDGSLLIVSAGNYVTENNRRVSEYIIWQNGFTTMTELEWPIQAIDLDLYGTKFAIASESYVTLIDLETSKYNESRTRVVNKHDNCITDVALHPEGTGLIVVASQKGVNIISIFKKDNDTVNLSHLIQGVISDIIKNIYYPSVEELLYITHDNQVKQINMHDLMEVNGGDIKVIPLEVLSLYQKVTIDQGIGSAVAYWNSGTKVIKDILCKIQVYRKNNQGFEKFMLDASPIKERYNYIAKFGERRVGIGQLLDVVLRDDYVAALDTDGQLKVWFLSECNPFNDEIINNTELAFTKTENLSNSSEKITQDINLSSSSRSFIPLDIKNKRISLSEDPNNIKRISSKGALLRQQYKRNSDRSSSSSSHDYSPRNSISYEKKDDIQDVNSNKKDDDKK